MSGGVITLGTYTVAFDAVYKATVIVLLTTIAASLAYIIHWIVT